MHKIFGMGISNISRCKVLLWFYIDFDEDQWCPPVEFKAERIVDALARDRLGFLSGSGCVSPLSLDIIKSLKGCVHGSDDNDEVSTVSEDVDMNLLYDNDTRT